MYRSYVIFTVVVHLTFTVAVGMNTTALNDDQKERTVVDGGITDKENKSQFQLNSFEEIVKNCVGPEELLTKRNWWSKKPNLPTSPRDYSIDDAIGSFITWNKARQQNGKTNKAKKMKSQRADQTGHLSKKQDMNERNTVFVKLPQILQKQRELEEFNKSEKTRIEKQDEALSEIDKLLAKLERDEPKVKKHSPKKQKLLSKTKEDTWNYKEDTPTNKPITYHDSFSDSLDKLLEDIEENMESSCFK